MIMQDNVCAGMRTCRSYIRSWTSRELSAGAVVGGYMGSANHGGDHRPSGRISAQRSYSFLRQGAEAISILVVEASERAANSIQPHREVYLNAIQEAVVSILPSTW